MGVYIKYWINQEITGYICINCPAEMERFGEMVDRFEYLPNICEIKDKQ